VHGMFSISSLVKISIMTSCDFFQFAFECEISQFFAWDYIINKTLHGGLKI
jgi:hypothetical protein